MNPLNQLLELAGQKDQIEAAMRTAVAQARTDGASWQAIANKIGGTKQAAQQKYSGIKAAEKLLADQVARDHAEDAPILAAYAAKREAAAVDQLPAETSIILDEDRAGDSITPSIFLEAAAPAKPRGAGPAQRQHGATLPGMPVEVAQPGTGKGPHTCTSCGSSNHKGGVWHTVEWNDDCAPTKYDPQDITDFLKAAKRKARETAQRTADAILGRRILDDIAAAKGDTK